MLRRVSKHRVRDVSMRARRGSSMSAERMQNMIQKNINLATSPLKQDIMEKLNNIHNEQCEQKRLVLKMQDAHDIEYHALEILRRIEFEQNEQRKKLDKIEEFIDILSDIYEYNKQNPDY